MAREEDRISIVRGAKSSRGGELLRITRCWSRRREGMLGKVNRYLDVQKMCKSSSYLDQERWVNVNKIRRGRGAVSQNFSTHRICQKVYL